MQNYKILLERKLPICYNYHVVVGSFLSTGKEFEIGKSLKGKDCGKGIYHRKDGLYHARFVDKAGKRHEKYFQTVPEARNWIGESKYADKHEDVFTPTDMTVNSWFDFWIENVVGDLALNMLRNYRERYKQNIQPIVGRTKLSDVKPMHCKKMLLQMDADYAGSTIRQTYITRAIESGMQPKVLQKLLGHASIKTTMDRYVHVTTETLDQAMQQFQSNRAFGI